MKTILPSRPLPDTGRMDLPVNKYSGSAFSLKERWGSFYHAGQGILHFLKSEPNARVHLAATILVALLSFYLGLNRMEAAVIVLCTVLVWVTEMINTAIEKAMDHISLEIHPRVRFIKDVAAGAVLVTAVGAALTGALVFIPKLFGS